MTTRYLKLALTTTAAVCALSATVTAAPTADKVMRVGTPCDMTKLDPILNGDDMKQCTADSEFVIPKIAAYDRGYERVPEKVCTSAACGKVITAIKALGLSECDLSKEVSSGNTVEVTLFNRHVDPVVALCGSDSSSFGARPTPDPDAMDDSKACTQTGIASYFWDQRSTLEECVGAKLTSLVASDGSGSRNVDVVEEFTVCPSCAKIKATIEASKLKIPTCQLPGRGTCFSKHLEYAFSYCEALVDLNNGKTPGDVLANKVMNTSATCRFSSRPMNAYLSPVENELFASEKCSALLFNPSKKLSDDDKKAVCDECPLAKAALAKIQVPTCLTSFGVSYKEFLTDALQRCTSEPSSGKNDPKQSSTAAMPKAAASRPGSAWNPAVVAAISVMASLLSTMA
ncbi:hypothetical protein PINS_up000898 [Pythium insidiosum]|nr:hypothetical protein PINS_up000898 [Pythium insidiosum]